MITDTCLVVEARLFPDVGLAEVMRGAPFAALVINPNNGNREWWQMWKQKDGLYHPAVKMDAAPDAIEARGKDGVRSN